MVTKYLAALLMLTLSHQLLAEEPQSGSVVSTNPLALANELKRQTTARGADPKSISARYKGKKYRIDGVVASVAVHDDILHVVWNTFAQRSVAGGILFGKKIQSMNPDEPSLVCMMDLKDTDYGLALKPGMRATMTATVMGFTNEGRYAGSLGGGPGKGALFLFCNQAKS